MTAREMPSKLPIPRGDLAREGFQQQMGLAEFVSSIPQGNGPVRLMIDRASLDLNKTYNIVAISAILEDGLSPIYYRGYERPGEQPLQESVLENDFRATALNLAAQVQDLLGGRQVDLTVTGLSQYGKTEHLNPERFEQERQQAGVAPWESYEIDYSETGSGPVRRNAFTRIWPISWVISMLNRRSQ